jgi:hypothetical protein
MYHFGMPIYLGIHAEVSDSFFLEPRFVHCIAIILTSYVTMDEYQLKHESHDVNNGKA